MREILLGLLIFIGLLFYQNIILSKKIAVLTKITSDIRFYLIEGNCDE